MTRQLLIGLLALGLLPAAATAGDAAFWQTPTIAGAGRIHPLPQAAYQPDRTATYKVVFLLTHEAPKPDVVNAALDHVARTVNLYTQAGVPLDHLKFVAVAAGGATAIALDDAAYKKLYGVANPNLPLIEQLRKAGVDVAVCGQAMAEHHYDYAWRDAHVTLALSALTTVTELQQQGYALLPM
jgi:intracellular sulfur oxidation DsrE/DsrF family protein